MPIDCIQPFLFDRLDVRGALVSLDRTWLGLTSGRDYAPAVRRLFGEMSAVTCLMAANLKQPRRMTFQLRGDGAVGLLVLDCDEQLRLRGMARGQVDSDAECLPVPVLLGEGQLVLTLDGVGMRQPYQSLVSTQGDSIAAIFEHYLRLSDQLPARLLLAADARRSVGLCVQKLPGADERDPDGWDRIGHLLGTLAPTEHLAHDPIDLLRRLFPEEEVRIFAPRPVRHHCPEDPEKIHAMLRSLGRSECDAILRERGEIQVHDEICGRDYRFDAEAVAELFAAPRHRMH